MPPKKQQTKAEKQKKQKAVEDKTFGMKNKNKSAKVQRYIQQVQSQAKGADQRVGGKKDKKELEKQKRDEFAELFKPVQVPQKVPFGTDPKTVLCIYFKGGHCEKGSKCKFSHDLNVGRKVEKKDLYTDDRAEDTMDKWDQQKLEEVVKSKSGKQPPTDIVCKYFLEAIETNKYGWFWECPNGGSTCKYRHALPPGFILKSKQSKEDDKEEISLEEFLEIERHKLGPNLTPVTLESFEQWKKNRIEKKEAEESAARKQKETRMKAGRSQGMSGRDLFDFNPTLAQAYDDEEDAIDFSQYDREETERERERLENEQYLTQKTGDLTLQDGNSPSQSDEQTKAEKQKKQKAVEDKTFGMKNKNKSAKVQRYIQQVQSQAKGADQRVGAKKDKKELEKQKRDEFAELFKPVQVPQKVPFGTDPKTVLCIYFKGGHCEKGSKCKFSHDLNVGRKVEKKDLYTDDRAEGNKRVKQKVHQLMLSIDTMDKWDQQKLEEVVKSKSGKQPPTDIVCKYFLEAIETNKYGWFWECPNGGSTCKYRHALPPGFILKSKQSKEDDKEEISLEEFLEIERHKLGPNLTPVTLESFEQWKKNRTEKKEAEESAARKQKETRMKAGRSQGMSGRDLFDFNPTLAQAYDDEEDAIDFSQYDREETERERERLENEQYLSQKTGDLTLQDGNSPSQSDEQVEQ
ncbi:Putative Cytoplasmic protein [Rhizopus microsporus]|nr:Putative Cytoplasmic protein [Rhizopus microsporus]